MITIKVRQIPNDDWPDGWAVFQYDRPELAEEHWEFLAAYKSDAVWTNGKTKTLQAGTGRQGPIPKNGVSRIRGLTINN